MMPRLSLDDLAGAGEDRWRDRQAERLGGLEIDNQIGQESTKGWS